MTSEEAAKVLGVELRGLNDNAISVAFARAVKLTHPDTGFNDVAGLDRAKQARDTLREFVAKGGGEPCFRCGGKGTVPHHSGIMIVKCPVCHGEGHA